MRRRHRATVRSETTKPSRFEELSISRARLSRVKNVSIVACGTSYHAGLVGRYILEALTPLSVS